MMRLLKTEFHDALEALKQNDNYETWKMRPAVHLPLQQASLPTVPLPDSQRRS